jgi:hypothetical protein
MVHFLWSAELKACIAPGSLKVKRVFSDAVVQRARSQKHLAP